jgi:RimJ/RimL family protein N-acetyltransferase
MYSSRGICKSLEDTRTWMSALLVETNPDVEVYAILLKPDQNKIEDDNNNNNIIGVIGTHKTDPTPVELSYILHPSAWGKGYATEALREYVQHYFYLKPQFDRLTAWVDTENAGSIKVLQKCGFVEEEMKKGDYVIEWKTPSKRDSILYVLKKC